MSKTVKQLIDRAFYKAGIKQEGIDLTADEYAAGVDMYQTQVDTDEAEGLVYGAAEATSETVDSNLPGWAVEYMQNAIALKAVSEFNKPVPPGLGEMFDKSLRAVERIVVTIPTPYYSSILPSGSSRDSVYSSRKYFGDQGADDIYGAHGGAIRDEEGNIIEDETQVNSLLGDRNL